MTAKLSIKKAYFFFLMIYIITLPLNAVSIGTLGSASRFLAIIPVGLALLSTKRIIVVNKCIVLYFSYLLLSAISILYSTDTAKSIERTTSYVMLFLLLFSVVCFEFDEDEIKKFKTALHLSSIISAVLILAFGTYINGRLWLTNSIIKEDPNYFCMYLSFGTICALDNILSNKKQRVRLLSLIELIVYLVICILTGSRGGLIALLAGIVFFLFFNKRKELSRKKIVLFLLIMFVLYEIVTSASIILQGRFSIENVINSGGSGRLTIWSQAIDLFKNSSWGRRLFGYGIASIRTNFIIGGYQRKQVMHNIFLETLIELGIVGLLVYVLMVFSFVNAAYKQEDKFAFGVIMSMVVMSLSTSIAAFKPYINIMMFILCNINSFKKSNSEVVL